MQKPIVLKYRNESLDELILELIQVRANLNAIGNNFNQAVKKLYTLNQISDYKNWIDSFETDKKVFFDTVETIKKHIQNLSQKWLQS